MRKQTVSRTKSLILIAVFTALIAVGAFIKIPLPGNFVPVTMQTAFVVMAGLCLGPARAAAAVAVYLALGLAGVPIFAAGGGFQYVFYPTFGYLLGFVLCACLTGVLYKKSRKKSFLAAAGAGLIGVFAVYALGLPYLYLIKDLYAHTPISLSVLFVNCFLIFLPGDIVTMLLAAYLATRLRKLTFLP